MVTIAKAVVRQNKKDGNEFLSLTLVGGLDIITSAKTGNQSLVAMRCNITSNLPVELAGSLIGEKLEGTVVKVKCAPYQWTNPTTAEVMEISHTYRYQKSAAHAPVGEDTNATSGADAAALAKEQRIAELRGIVAGTGTAQAKKAAKLELAELED